MFFVDPLYPYLLGALYWVFGHHLLVIRLLQAAVGVMTVGLVGYLGRRLGNRAVGNVAALMYALYAPAIFNDAEIEKTAFATFFLLVAVTQSLRGTRTAGLLSGVALGLATLCRANIILLALPLGLYAARGSNGWSPRRAIPLVLGCALVLAPVVWRNYHVGGELVIVGSAGQNLYLGNNPYNTGGSYGRLPFVRPTPEFEEEDFRRAAEANTGHAMRSGEVSRYWARAAVDHVRAHPWFAARMLVQKARLLFNHYEVPDNQDMYFVARYSPVLRWSLPGFGWIFPLGVLGLIVSWPRRDVRLIAATMALVLVFRHSLFRARPVSPAPHAVLGGVRCIGWPLAVARGRAARVSPGRDGDRCRGVLRSRGHAGSPISRPRGEPGACLAQPGCAAGARRSLRPGTGVRGSRRPAAARSRGHRDESGPLLPAPGALRRS